MFVLLIRVTATRNSVSHFYRFRHAVTCIKIWSRRSWGPGI